MNNRVTLLDIVLIPGTSFNKNRDKVFFFGLFQRDSQQPAQRPSGTTVRIPTPALTCYAISLGKGSIMVTGSHIPFDRNGYKVNTSVGELLKKHEDPVNGIVQQVRQEIYRQPFAAALFDENGRFKAEAPELPLESASARTAYIERYTLFFRGLSLDGKRLVVYQHSAVGRDILVEILERLGASVIPAEISSVERSSARGISDAEGRNSWPLDSKNARYPARSSAVVRMAAIVRAVDSVTRVPELLQVHAAVRRVERAAGVPSTLRDEVLPAVA